MTANEEDTTIVESVIDALVDVSVLDDSNRRTALYDYVDPDALEILEQRDDVEWLFRFRAEAYTVEVDSTGAVTVIQDTPDVRPTQ